ncbi:MAG TPA: hypothetical protein VLC49_03870 [Solirubrobacteraceae bacterium]|nr:hypothetical protein [Solirubrobacteraceae bacterium]
MRAIRGRSRANERERRQSGRLTRRQLKQALSRHGRKWVREVWQAAARTSGDMTRLSPVTTPLGNRLVESYAASERLAGGEIQRALRIATVAGYATRVVVGEPTEQPSLRPSAFGLGAHPDVGRLARDPDRLLDPVRAIATDRFESVMTLPPEVWTSYVATAAMKLQGQLASGKELSWQVLTRSRIEQMLRYGYVMRCLDEAIDAEPESRQAE